MANRVQQRVLLYGRAGCHLCDDAREVVRAVCDETGVDWAEVDIDAGPYDGRDLADELGELVPVVEVDGVQQGYWRIDPARLRRALTRGAVRPLP
ncbi:glutaredoxin family protein [Cellulomonas sp. URHD0024]|uniref:glutaredoxin family protein n=1 Tax=Cellulomonas sp. URHD0024 TaxID=1302620 RepID=UPI000408A517|nr:glutaredoxin family protein [Cellulomonas sp. URHD0024]